MSYSLSSFFYKHSTLRFINITVYKAGCFFLSSHQIIIHGISMPRFFPLLSIGWYSHWVSPCNYVKQHIYWLIVSTCLHFNYLYTEKQNFCLQSVLSSLKCCLLNKKTTSFTSYEQYIKEPTSLDFSQHL